MIPSRIGVMCLLMACNGASSGAATASSQPVTPAEQTINGKPRPKGDPQPTLPMGRLEIESPEVPPPRTLTLDVEVADDDRERETGLMFREQLGENHGMLFIFPGERVNTFWMHNTLIPLDMIFIDASWNVVGVTENAEPLTDDPRGVNEKSQYVLEVNAGFAKRHGIKPGVKMHFTPPGGAQ